MMNSSSLTESDSQSRHSSSSSTVHYDRNKRRRANQFNPDHIKISEITKPILRTSNNSENNKKFVIPKTNEIFHFQCEGIIPGNSNTRESRYVRWDAKFDKPIEQLIYPSLQRFNNESYEERRKVYNALHGQHDAGVVVQQQQQHTSMMSQFADGVRIDLLPDSEQPDPKLTFLYTPKWTVNILPVGANTGQVGNTTQSSGTSSTGSSPKHAINESQSSSLSLLEEIDIEGERFLRTRIRERYQDHMESIKREKKEQELMNSPFHLIEKRKTKMSSGRLTPLTDNGDRVYGALMARSLARIEHDQQKKPDSPKKSNQITKLTELTPLEAAYSDQIKVIREVIPSDLQHMQPAMLYFRARNQINQAHMQEMETLNRRNMTFTVRHSTRKASDHFGKRVALRRSSSDDPSSTSIDSNEELNNKLARLSQSIDEMHALRNEDHLQPTAADLNDLPDLHELHLGRLTRAVANRIVTFSRAKPKSNGQESKSPSREALAGSRSQQGQRKGTQDLYLAPNAREEESILAELNKREAQDRLLLHQLEAGVLPESFIRTDADCGSIVINLSKYGIGDKKGLCLGKCLAGLDRLESLGLSDNRLTATSLETIIRNASPTSLVNLDLSFNGMHDQGAKAIAQHFRHRGNVLRYLDLSNCSLECSDISIMCSSLKVYNNMIEELYLSGNKIRGEGAAELCSYLSSSMCKLISLDLSWNTIGDNGALEFGQSLAEKNRTLLVLNLAANAINDYGGQRFMDSIAFHPIIQEINLAQNNISDRTCFVVSQVLSHHTSMKKLDLSLNPLGEAGARSIFRTILRGLRCFVTMRNCSYADDPKIYKHSYPTYDNPYLLDLSEPYCNAVVQELLYKFQEDSGHCGFDNMTYRESPKSPEQSIQLTIVENSKQGRQVCMKGYNDSWIVPRTGIVKFNFSQSVFVPTVANKIDKTALNILQLIVENGVTENDKKMWLFLLCQDLYFTTEQAQAMIDRFKKNHTIAPGGLTVLDLVQSLWKYLVDTENMFDFLLANADRDQRRDLAYGHWTLLLSDKVQRSIMMKLIAINNSESEFSKNLSGRQDTSQMGNWYNFRNGQYTVDGVTSEKILDKDFLKNLPAVGTLDFDYVSTSRPSPQAIKQAMLRQQQQQTAAKQKKEEDEELDEEQEDEDNNNDNDDGSDAKSERAQTLLLPRQGSGKSSKTSTPRVIIPSSEIESKQPFQQQQQDEEGRPPVRLINDEEFYHFLVNLGLSNRRKIASSQAVFALMDLQLANTKYYFKASQVNLLLDSFEEHWELQTRVIVAIFSRIYDLHNMDIILRNLPALAQHEIVRRLGCLNVLNPLKIAFDYVFPLQFLDNRILVVTLMELASIESADQIQEDPNTELPIATLYGSYTRALNEVRSEVMRFSFADFGVRTNNISWSTRRELLKKFLVGTLPIDEDVYRVINLFKEMEAANALTRGPIDLQYATYQKTSKSTAGRTTKTTKSLVNAMRSIAAVRSPKY